MIKNAPKNAEQRWGFVALLPDKLVGNRNPISLHSLAVARSRSIYVIFFAKCTIKRPAPEMPEFAKDDHFVATLIAGAAVMLGKDGRMKSMREK
jgi:hypothetical protein